MALGGPDTTQRIKLLRRVKRLTVSATTCDAAWQEATALWLQRDGRRFDPDTMRLEPVARLQVGFTQALAQRDPCDPVATGGYFGVDNQLIRVQIDGTSQQPSLLWSYDNASFLYRITSVSEDRTMLTLAKDPPDAFHIPQTGQLVEVLKTTAVLGREPDETDPTGQSVRLSCGCRTARRAAAADAAIRPSRQWRPDTVHRARQSAACRLRGGGRTHRYSCGSGGRNCRSTPRVA